MHERTDSLSPYYPFHVGAGAATATPLAGNVTTTSATTIVAGNGVVVTPASMVNIIQGMTLNFSAGTGTTENVVVQGTTATTFTATFVNGHSGAYNIVSMRPQYFGSLIFNTTGFTNVVLYNGSPLLNAGSTGTGVLIASIATPSLTFPYIYNCYCTRGLFYTATFSGSASMTFMVVDDSVI